MLSLREGKMPQIVRFVLQSCTFRFRDYTRRSGTFHYDRVASEPGMAALSVVKRAVPHRMEYGTGIWKRLLKD